MNRAILFALALATSLAVSAQVLYKLVDKNGKVTYSEKVPEGFQGQATRVDIDPNRNTAVLPKPAAVDTETVTKQAKPLNAPDAAQVRKEKRIEDAKKALDDAKAALAEALANPSEDEVMRMGTVKGGARPVWSDDYKSRISNLESQVKAAEQKLADAQASN